MFLYYNDAFSAIQIVQFWLIILLCVPFFYWSVMNKKKRETCKFRKFYLQNYTQYSLLLIKE